MSFVSLEFIIFVVVSLLIYYVLPTKIRWIALLIMSYAFYFIGGGSTIVYLIFTTITTYLAARGIDFLNQKNKKVKSTQEIKKNQLIQKENQNQKAKQIQKSHQEKMLNKIKSQQEKMLEKIKNQKRFFVAFAVVSNFSLLFFFKYWNNLVATINGVLTSERLPAFELILPLGISFYIFQSIGYVIDVYRNKYPAEKNLLKFALFVSFFPQVIQGPISRFNQLGNQLFAENKFSYDNLKDGIQLAMWGYLKKLVIADRAAIVVNEVFNNYTNYDGGVILIGVILYCVQLYCDFSGGIDITRAVAKMFGINMTENFKRPIFATSLADFWRRWHISLGTWMKDYLFYPLSLSKLFIKLGKWIRNHLSGKAGKIIPVSLVTFIVYFAIGIWHGSSLKYIVFGLWNGVLITASLLLEPFFINVKTKLKIDDKKPGFKGFQILRTAILVLIGRYITRAGRFLAAVEMLKLTVTKFTLNGIFNGTLLNFGLTLQDYIVVLIGTFVLLIVEAFDEAGKNLRIKINHKNFGVQWAVMMVSLLVLLVFGICRGDYIASEFIYKQF